MRGERALSQLAVILANDCAVRIKGTGVYNACILFGVGEAK
jgi:hypothetical protein